MSARKSPKTGHRADVLPETTRPENPEQDFDVSTALLELNAAAADSKWFAELMERAENTRLCEWDGKTGTGRKDESRASKAKPWPGAADHEVHLVQELLDERDAARVAALSRGALSVTPMDGTDMRKATLMKQVLRYYLSTGMKSQVLVHGLRMGSWADRWGHSLLYVGWKTERAVERRSITLGRLVEIAIQMQTADLENAQGAPPAPEQAAAIEITSEDIVMDAVLDPAREEFGAGLLLAADEGLRARGTAGVSEAKRAIRELRSLRDGGWNQEDPLQSTVHYVSSFVKTSAPCWEALRPFIDVFYPAETAFEDNLDGARWVARVKRLNAQQLKEQAAIHGWDKAWLKEVLENHRGKSSGFNERMGRPWGMNGAGVRWRARMATGTDSGLAGGESQKNLYEIIEMWDRSTTPDGLTGTYHTVFHAHVTDKFAKRKLLEYWSGCYPFVACVAEKAEMMLLDSRGLPERLKGDQDAVKVQWDSRTNAAALTTLPPWTGPAELRGTKVRPGEFVESYRLGEVTAFQLPPPDNRSVEIEKTIRASVDRRFGRVSETVPEAISMMMGQADMDWFLMAFSQAIALTARLIQQFMPPLKAARITGVQELPFDASPDEVRGSYDFLVAFDVRGLDIEWAKQMLTFVKDLLVPLDRRGQIKTGPLIEFGLNLLTPALADRCFIQEEEANEREKAAAKASVVDIFTGGAGEDPHEGMDFETRAKTFVDEYQRSPMRQQLVNQVPQIKEVFTMRLKQLVDNAKQYTDNVIAGQQMGETPLGPKSEAEELLDVLQGAMLV